MLTPFIRQNPIVSCKYPEVAGCTPEAIENMFINQTIRTFDGIIEIEFEDGTLACYFKDNACYQSFFFTHDE